jgi:flagellar hook-associated protein 2
MAVDTNLVTALGAGSGIDIKSLAKNLAAAETNPRKDAIQNKIDKSETKISGLSAVMAVLNNFKAAVDGLDSTTDFGGGTVSNSAPGAIVATTAGTVATGRNNISVSQLAQEQRTRSFTTFSSPSQVLTASAAPTFVFTFDDLNKIPQTVTLSSSSTTPQDLVNAINDKDMGIQASLVDTGASGSDRYVLVLEGETGADGGFDIVLSGSGASDIISFDDADGELYTLQPAQDAQLTLNGVSATRSTNEIDDLITGVNLSLVGTTAGATLQVGRDTAPVKEKVQALVDAYNQMVADFAILTGDPSDDEEDVFSGALRGDSTVRTILARVRADFFGESDTSSGGVTGLRDLGISVDKSGVLTLDETQLDEALANSFDDVAMALGGRKSVTEGDATVIKRGLAVELGATLRDLMSTQGVVMTGSATAESQVSKYEDELSDLEERYEAILARYTKQFAAMESLVGQMNSLRESLKGQFEALAAAYGGK